MCSYGVSEVSTGTGERVSGMVNETSLALGLLQGWEPVGVAGLWGQRLVSTMSWWRLGVFSESDVGRFGEEVLG